MTARGHFVRKTWSCGPPKCPLKLPNEPKHLSGKAKQGFALAQRWRPERQTGRRGWQADCTLSV